MSIETWKQEFLPTPAVAMFDKSDSECVKHALLKWSGLSHENLSRHGVAIHGTTLTAPGGAGFVQYSVGGADCSLCQKYPNSCAPCPITKSRGGISCDDQTDDELERRESSPWRAFTGAGDTAPMINALEAAKDYCDE